MEKLKLIKLNIDQRPISINSFYGNNRRGCKYISDKGRMFQDYVRYSLMKYHKPFKNARLSLEIEFTFKGKRKVDLDNYLKPLIDCLKGTLFDDDEQIDVIFARKEYGTFDNVEIVIRNLNHPDNRIFNR